MRWELWVYQEVPYIKLVVECEQQVAQPGSWWVLPHKYLLKVREVLAQLVVAQGMDRQKISLKLFHAGFARAGDVQVDDTCLLKHFLLAVKKVLQKLHSVITDRIQKPAFVLAGLVQCAFLVSVRLHIRSILSKGIVVNAQRALGCVCVMRFQTEAGPELRGDHFPPVGLVTFLAMLVLLEYINHAAIFQT